MTPSLRHVSHLAKRLQEVALALAGQSREGTPPTGEPAPCAHEDELTAEVLNTVERSLWRRYNDRVVGDYLSARVGKAGSIFLKTDVFEEAVGSRLCPQTLSGNMVGTDISRTVLDQAHRRVPRLSLVRADVRRLPFSQGVLAGVVSTSTLDHFQNPWDLERSLGEIARVLRPGGQLLLTLDNPWNPLLAFRNVVPHRWRLRLRMTPYYVGSTYDPIQVVGVLEGKGFEVREVRAVLHFPRTLVGLWGLFSRKTGLTRFDPPLLRTLRRAELMATWRTRWLTGQYIAVQAVRRSD